MSWHYGITRQTTVWGDLTEDGFTEDIYSVCEVYEIEGDTGHTGPVYPLGDTIEELIECLDMMKRDLLKYTEIHEWEDN